MVKNIIDLLTRSAELNRKYGWLSCFDYPKEYEEMDDLSTQARELAETFSRDLKDTSTESLLSVCNDIAVEIVNGNIHETAEIHFYSQDEWIELYITENMDQSAVEVFDSLFYWMDSDSRAGWLKSRHLNHDSSAWTDQRVTFVIHVY